MFRVKGLSQRNISRTMKTRVDRHMEDISRPPRKAKISKDNYDQGVEPALCVSDVNDSCSTDSETLIQTGFICPGNKVYISSSYSSSSEISNAFNVSDNNINESLQVQLRQCFIKHNATHALINDVLNILKTYHNLPCDARTLLKTPQYVPVKKICGGDFVYFGLLSTIKEKVKEGSVKNTPVLNLSFNIDGLPLHKSSNKQFWPILCKIDLDENPFPVAIFCGSQKPANVNEFLADLIDEITSLTSNQTDIGFKIKIKAFICDAPARSFVKCVKSHNGYFGCERCCQKGEWCSRMTFQDCNSPKRKDSDFFSNDNENEHIKGRSPLLNLNLGLVTQFPLDYMHLVCLGVMRKLLISWTRGPLGVRLCSRDIDNLSANLTSFIKNIPSEFPRKPRSLRELDRWKATEFRSFLLYLGPIVLKNLLTADCYTHFLSLHIAIRILSNEVSLRHLSFARELLLYFVKKGQCLYGSEFLVYNVHNLIHLCDDVETFGPLDSFSSFPFENYLGQLKRLLRTPNKPLEQICRRLLEISQQKNNNAGEIKDFQVVKTSQHEEGPTASLDGLQFKIAKKSGFIIRCDNDNSSDNCVLLENETVMYVSNLILSGSKLMFVGRKFKLKTNFYTQPCSSSILNIFFVSKLSSNYATFPVSYIKEKGILLPYQDGFVYISLIHSIKDT